jgi:hypothetical protein
VPCTHRDVLLANLGIGNAEVQVRPMLSERNLSHVSYLNQIAQRRGQSLAQMALAWVLENLQLPVHSSARRRLLGDLTVMLRVPIHLEFSGPGRLPGGSRMHQNRSGEVKLSAPRLTIE